MHHDCKLSRNSDTGLRVAFALRKLLSPRLDRVATFEPGQHRRCGFVERTAHIGIARFADTPLHIDRASRLPSLRRQPEVGGDIARAPEALWIIDRTAEDERGDRSDAGDRHEAPT